MKNIIKLSFVFITLTLINTTVFGQVDSTWTVRTDFKTPAGLADTAQQKEVYFIVNLPLVPAIKYIDAFIGTSEGSKDIFEANITVEYNKLTAPAYLSNEGFVVIPAGVLLIDPNAFYSDIKLFDYQMTPLN